MKIRSEINGEFSITSTAGIRPWPSRSGNSPDLPLRLQDNWNIGDPIFVAQDPTDPGKYEVDLFDVRAEDFAMLKRSATRSGV